MRFEEFAECNALVGRTRSATDAPRTSERGSTDLADIEASGCNLDLKNPNRADDLAHRPPAELIAELIATEEEILVCFCEARSGVRGDSMRRVRVGDVLELQRRSVADRSR